MRNWAELTKEEQENVVKTFCKLHESRECSVYELTRRLNISRETVGWLCCLWHLYSDESNMITKKKKKRFSQRRSS